MADEVFIQTLMVANAVIGVFTVYGIMIGSSVVISAGLGAMTALVIRLSFESGGKQNEQKNF